jgi:hypothetical protein
MTSSQWWGDDHKQLVADGARRYLILVLPRLQERQSSDGCSRRSQKSVFPVPSEQ